MLQSFKEILSTKIHALDGNIGHLDDLLFDDENWVIRYIVVKTGGLLHRERVLISPLGVAKMDWYNQIVKLNLTRAQIESSPKVETDLPVFRQMEKKYFDYYGWPYYWDNAGTWGIDARGSMLIGSEIVSEQSEGKRKKIPGADPNLRSCRIVSGYSLEVENTQFGHVEDFMIDESWKIQNLVVRGKKWWPDQPIAIAPKSIRGVNWMDQSIQLSMTKKEIEAQPEFDVDANAKFL